MAVVYAIAAWLIVQVAVALFPMFGVPDWASRLVVILLAIGFPIALILTWGFELTPEGMQRSRPPEDGGMQVKPVGRSRFDYAIIGLMIIAIGWLLFRTEIDTPDVPVASAAIEATIEPAEIQPAETAVLNNSIAVLPFENFSPDPNDEYFAAGIHEELLNQLAKIKDLSILARTTMRRYANSDLSVPEIPRQRAISRVR